MSKHDNQPATNQQNLTEELNINEIQSADLTMDQIQAETVRGGAAYIKFDGIDGEVAASAPVQRLK